MNSPRFIFVHLLFVIIGAFGFLLLFEAKSEISEIKLYTKEIELPLLGMTASSSFGLLAMKYEEAGGHLLDNNFLREWILNGEKDPESLMEFLKKVRDEYQLLDTSIVSDLTETYYCSDGRILKMSPENIERDSWYYHYRQNAEETNIDSWFFRETGVLGLYVNIPVKDQNGKFIGVTGGGVDASIVNEFLREIEDKWDVNLFLARDDGQLIYASDNEILSSGIVYIDDLWNCKVLDPLTRRKNDSSGIIIQPDSADKLLWGGYMPEWDSFFLIERGGPLRNSIRRVLRRTIFLEVMIAGFMLLLTVGALRITYIRSVSSVSSGRKVVHYLQSIMYIKDSLLRKSLRLLSGENEGDANDLNDAAARIRQCFDSIQMFRSNPFQNKKMNNHNLNDFINDFIISKTPAAEKRHVSLISRLRSSSLLVHGDEAILNFIVEDLFDYVIGNASPGSEIVFVAGKLAGGVFAEAAFSSRTLSDSEPEFQVLNPIFEAMNIVVRLKPAGTEKFILRLGFHLSGE